MALVMARSAKRVAVKYGDLGLARAARVLHQRAMLAIKNRQSVLSDCDDERMSPKLKLGRRVVAGPSIIDGGIARVVEMPDGSGKTESWSSGVGWIEGGASLDEFVMAQPVSAKLAARLGIPPSELGSEACAMQKNYSVKRNPRGTTEETADCIRSPTDSEMGEMSEKAMMRGLQELLAERKQQKKKD